MNVGVYIKLSIRFFMNKSDFIRALANEAETSVVAASEFLDAFERAIQKALSKDEKVQITGFLTFTAKRIAATTGRNPKTGETIKIAATTRISVKVGKKLKEFFKKKK